MAGTLSLTALELRTVPNLDRLAFYMVWATIYQTNIGEFSRNHLNPTEILCMYVHLIKYSKLPRYQYTTTGNPWRHMHHRSPWRRRGSAVVGGGEAVGGGCVTVGGLAVRRWQGTGGGGATVVEGWSDLSLWESRDTTTPLGLGMAKGRGGFGLTQPDPESTIWARTRCK